jgi:ABC-type xylose transport system substrate-binding protein
MTVFKRYSLQAYKAAELAMSIVNCEKIPEGFTNFPNGYKDVPSFLFDPILVDINNMKTTLIADGIYKENEIYN